MRILFDQGTPAPLRYHLSSHVVHTVFEQGWSTLSNGSLLKSAEQAGYDLFITTDQNLRYQQNLAGSTLAILVLLSTSWPRIQTHLAEISTAVDEQKPGAYREIVI